MGSMLVTFTVGELWMLHDFVRHDEDRDERAPPRWPVVSTELNGEIALAINACLENGLNEYVLDLELRDLLIIDYWVRRDHKTIDAKGDAILIKAFKARAALLAEKVIPWPVGGAEHDASYKEAKETKEAKDASTSDSPGEGPGDGPDASPGANPGA